MATHSGGGRAGTTNQSRAAHFFVPRSHRLFAVFDSRRAAESALEDLSPADSAATWIFEGTSGSRELDPGHGAGLTRLTSWVFSHNLEYFRGLSHTVATGKVVVAVPARSVRAAEDVGRVLIRHGGRVLAYTAHWNFVPMTQ